MRGWLGLGALFAAGACSFSGSSTPRDADASSDATTDSSPSNDAGCTSTAEHVDVCALPDSDGDLDINADAVYDTDLGMFVSGGFPDPSSALVTQPGGESLRVVIVDSFRIRNNATFRAIGSQPLVVVSDDDIEIEGALDVGGIGDVGGAGSDSSLCGPSTGGKGDDVDPGGGPAGGGGGFASVGGAGAIGDNNGNNFPGGIAGIAVDQPPTLIRGGCAGGDGGSSDGTTFGVGGAGGGAVELVAKTRIRVIGSINAGGGGGGGAPMGERGGGGGGGSGGYIGLDAPLVRISGGTVAANGGGGGEGADLTSPLPCDPGDDGDATLTAASGGTGGTPNGGDGGDGGVLGGLDGATGIDNIAGGGGGGGGVGFVFVFTDNLDDSGSISPAPTP